MNDQHYSAPPQSSTPSPPPPASLVSPPPPWWWQSPPAARKGCLGRLKSLVFILSIVLNIYLLLAIAAMSGAPAMSTTVLQSGDSQQVVAVYRLEGMIDETAVRDFARFHREVADDKDVKAVVIRVDSPGGTISASDQIHALVEDLRKTWGKKVVVSMGGVAASGGYYVSAPADEILAEPTTVTGSVGVLMTWLVVKGTLDKLGMEAMVLKSSDTEGWKDMISMLKKPDDRQRAALQKMLDEMQARFEQVVRQGRGSRLKTDKVTYTVTVGEGAEARQVERTDVRPFNGEIFMPDQALSLGLIDAIGYEQQAVDRAGELADLARPKVVVYSPRRSFLERLAEGRSQAGVQITPDLLDRLQSPRLLMLWVAD